MRISNARFNNRPMALGLGVVSALFATGMLYLSTSDAMLRAQFVTAFDSYSGAAPVASAGPKARNHVATIPMAAAEDAWLGSAQRKTVQADIVQPASWTSSVAIGDEISISGPSGRRAFEVIAITELPVEGVTHIAHSSTNSGLLLVTGREKGVNHGPLIRFVIDRNDANGLGAKMVSPHTL